EQELAAAEAQRKVDEENARKRADEQREDDAAYAAAVGLDQAAGFKAYIDQHPNGRHIDEARKRMTDLEHAARDAADDAAWTRALSLNTLAGYRGYLAALPDGRHADESKKLIDRLAGLSQRWDQLKSRKSPELLRQLLADANGTEFAPAIEATLDRLE